MLLLQSYYSCGVSLLPPNFQTMQVAAIDNDTILHAMSTQCSAKRRTLPRHKHTCSLSTCVRDPRNRKLYGVVVRQMSTYARAPMHTLLLPLLLLLVLMCLLLSAQCAKVRHNFGVTGALAARKMANYACKQQNVAAVRRDGAQHGQFLQSCRREARPFCHFRSARGVTTTTSTRWIRNDEDDKNDVAAVLCAVAHQTHRPTPQT